MYKKLLFIIIIVFILFLYNNGNTEIKNEALKSEYDKMVSRNIEDPVKKAFENCIRECFDDNTSLLGRNIYNLEVCLEESYDCVTCVDDCINSYEIDDYEAMKIARNTRNYCFINLL